MSIKQSEVMEMEKGNYETPVGTFKTWEEAMERMEQIDMGYEVIKYTGAA